jgi:hypothetical protein
VFPAALSFPKARLRFLSNGNRTILWTLQRWSLPAKCSTRISTKTVLSAYRFCIPRAIIQTSARMRARGGHQSKA